MRAKTTLLSIFEQTERPSRGGLSEIRSGVLIVNVRSCPKADKLLRCSEMTLSAISGLMHRSKQHIYSITSSARVRSAGGMVRPSALAVSYTHLRAHETVLD